MLYVLSVPTWTPEVSERIEAFRSVYERARAAIVPAHITLVFGALGINKEELTAHVGWIARQTAPFGVSFSSAEIHRDMIDGGYKLFLMTKDGADTLSTLHEALYAARLRDEPRTDIPYRPHMTVATADTEPGSVRSAELGVAAHRSRFRTESLRETAKADDHDGAPEIGPTASTAWHVRSCLPRSI